MESSDPEVLWLLGQDAHEQGNRDQALRYWRQAADLGSIFAAVQVGLLLEDSDPAEAAARYRTLTSSRACFVSQAQASALLLARNRLQLLDTARRRAAAAGR